MAETSMREGAREVAQNMRPSEINPKLEEAVQNQPLLPHLLEFRPILIGLAAGAVVAVILFFLIAPMVAGLALILVFFATWIGLSVRNYAQANEARERERESEEEEEDS
jgi:uncharacterized membrane protein